jgi:hypothetical protein
VEAWVAVEEDLGIRADGCHRKDRGVVAVVREDIELHLSGLNAPAGTISLGDLAPLAAGLQLLTTRIARDLHGHTGPGRVVAPIEEIARLRLGAVRDGSTTLLLSAGDDTLPIEHPVETETFDKFWQVLAGLGEGRRPSWVTPPVAQAALDLAGALSIARSVEFRGARAGRSRPAVYLASSSVDRTAWRMHDDEPDRLSGVTVSGVLDLVDLRRRTFRIRDDVGHDITLVDVENATEAGSLVGQRVAANGEAILGDRGQILQVRSAIVESTAVPTDWTATGRTESGTVTLMRALAEAVSRPGPSIGGIDGITDDDVDEFLTVLHT